MSEYNESYTLTITSSAGGTPIVQTGTLTTKNGDIGDIDVSSLPDGILTFSIVLSPSGETDEFTATKDTVLPSGYSIAFDKDPFGVLADLTLSGLEVGAIAYWGLSGSGVEATSGNLKVTSATENISVDVSSFSDGVVNASLYLIDKAGNQGANTTDSSSKDLSFTTAWNMPAAATTVTPANIDEAGINVAFDGWSTGDTFTYTITASDASGTPYVATVPFSSNSQDVTGIDLSGQGFNIGTSLEVSVVVNYITGGASATETDTINYVAFTYSFLWNTDPIDPSNQDAAAFNVVFLDYQAGDTVNYVISSSTGGSIVVEDAPLTGSTTTFNGIDVSSLNADFGDTIVVTGRVNFATGNQGALVSDNAAYNAFTYTVAWTTDPVIYTGDFDINMPDYQAGDTYDYTITASDGSGTPVTGSGSLSGTTTSVTGVDVDSAGFNDGVNLTVSVTVNFATGGTGAAATDVAAYTAPTAPTITGVPTFSGTENVGEDLTAVFASSSGVPTPTDSIQWQRNDGVTGWIDISGATSLVYTLVLADEGNYVRCVQTSTNAEGSDTAESVSSGAILPEVTTDPDYQAVLDYATAQGYTLPSSAQQETQNQLVVDLKAAGVWSKLDSFSVFATDGDSNFALIDWVRLSMYTSVNSPSFTTNQGYKGDGISAYLNTNLNLQSLTNYQLNDASIFMYIFTADSGINGYYSGANDTNRAYVRRGLFCVNGNSDNFMSPPPSSSFAQFVTNGSTLKRYLNGVNDDNLNRTPTGIPSVTLYILARNNSGSRENETDGCLSVHGYGSALESEAVAFNTAIQTYMSAI